VALHGDAGIRLANMLTFPWEEADAGVPATPAAPAVPAHLARVVADGSNRMAWLKARSTGVTATDVARLSGPQNLAGVAYEKINGSGFGGNVYTDYGTEREPHILRWVNTHYGILPSAALFHAAGQPKHLATPDGLAVSASGALELAEIKTTNKAWRSIPRHYLRQVWWQQYVLGAERTLVVWEQHDDFIPVGAAPECRWVDRDENEIAILVSLADRLLELMRAG
jgi:hypothetical protein